MSRFWLLTAALLAGCSSTGLPALPSHLSLDRVPQAVQAEIHKAYEEARSAPGNGSACGRLGMVLQAYEQFESAARCYQRARTLAPKDLRWTYYLATTQVALQQWADAAETLRAFLNVEKGFLPARLTLGRVLLELNALDEAERTFSRVLAENPQAFEAHYGLGRAFLKQGKPSPAVGHLRKACEIFPRCGPARYTLALALRDLGRASDAAEQFAQYQREPVAHAGTADALLAEIDAVKTGDALGCLKKGMALEAAGQLQAATSEMLRALELAPQMVQVHANLVAVYGKMGQPERAAEMYQTALALDATPADLHYNYGVVLMNQQHWPQAADAFRRAIEANPAHAQAHLNLGQVLERLGSSAKAMDQYRLAVEYKPNYRLGLFHLARMLLDRNRTSEAAKLLERTLTPEDEQTPVYLLALANAHTRMGHSEQGLAYARQAKEMAAKFGTDIGR